jgi:hypothetical protein
VSPRIYTAAGDPANDFTDKRRAGVDPSDDWERLTPQPTDPQHTYMLVAPPAIIVQGIFGEHSIFEFKCSDGTARNVHFARDSDVGRLAMWSLRI